MKKTLICILIIMCLLATSGTAFAQSGSMSETGAAESSATSATTPTPTPSATRPPVREPEKYTMKWIERYAPASVASFDEQVGDNGEYDNIIYQAIPGTYQLIVDYNNQCVRAYKKNMDGYYVLERLMICTTGGNGNWTPEGTYHMGDEYHRFGFFPSFDCYAQYWSQMAGSFFFHSILYSARDASTYSMSSYNNLGTPGSHGCIRLLVPDARWIFENCAPGTTCIVTTDIERDETLKSVLKNGYESAIDYIPSATDKTNGEESA